MLSGLYTPTLNSQESREIFLLFTTSGRSLRPSPYFFPGFSSFVSLIKSERRKEQWPRRRTDCSGIPLFHPVEWTGDQPHRLLIIRLLAIKNSEVLVHKRTAEVGRCQARREQVDCRAKLAKDSEGM